MCIYYKGDGLTYVGQEHVFSAAIGGKQVLPYGLVSDQFNSDFSKIEQEMFRNGLLSVPRTMLGPGKRGSLAESKATKSKIHVIKSLDSTVGYALGYTISGKAKQEEIPHIAYNNDTKMQGFSCNKMPLSDAEQQLNIFKARALEPDTLKIKWVNEERLPKNLILIGIKDGVEENFNCFFFKHPDNPVEFLDANIVSLAGGIKTSDDPAHIKYMPQVLEKFKYDIEHERLFGKTAVNFLALVKGNEFVNQNYFEKVKQWISEGGDYVGWANDTAAAKFSLGGLDLPKDAHSIIIFKEENNLVAKVSFYNHFGRYILLTENYKEPFTTDGFICDWRNEKEYRVNDYIKKKASNDPSSDRL